MKVSEVAAHVNSSAGYLSALFRKYKNMSLKKFFDSSRMEYIRKYLAYSDLTMTEIAENSGFEDVYSFSRFVKTQTGLAPLKLRNKLKREESEK
jgi:AraC family transcriptional activator of pobA